MVTAIAERFGARHHTNESEARKMLEEFIVVLMRAKELTKREDTRKAYQEIADAVKRVWNEEGGKAALRWLEEMARLPFTFLYAEAYRKSLKLLEAILEF